MLNIYFTGNIVNNRLSHKQNAKDLLDRVTKDISINKYERKSLLDEFEKEDFPQDSEFDVQALGKISNIIIDNMCYSLDEQGNLTKEKRVDNNGKDARINTEKTTSKYNIFYNAHTLPNMRLSYSVKQIRDKQNNHILTEYFIPSKVIKGKHDIWEKDVSNKKHQIASIERTPEGDLNIEKTFVSPAGVKTQYFYVEDKKGNRAVNIKITDKHGTILANNNQQFKKLDDNHYKSIENGVIYDIQYKPRNVVVKNENTKAVVKVPIGFDKTINNVTLPICKTLPGSQYFDIYRGGLKEITSYFDPESDEEHDAYYDHDNNYIYLSPDENVADNTFSLLHELGHYKDFVYTKDNDLWDDNVLRSVYNQERKDLLVNGCFQESDFMDYFTFPNNEEDDHVDEPLSELIAETNAIMYSNNLDPDMDVRGDLMLKYYPRTVAYIINKLT